LRQPTRPNSGSPLKAARTVIWTKLATRSTKPCSMVLWINTF